MRRLAWIVVVIAALMPPARAGAAPVPRVAYDTNSGDVRVAAVDGTVTATATNASPYFSFSGGVLAVSRPTLNGGSRVVGIDGSTGTSTFTIKDAFFPLIAGQGSRVVFLPDGHAGGPNDRDPTINSVWFDDVASSRDHRLVRFTDSDRIPLNLAISPKGGRVAITHGNDADLFQWDIWTARTDHHLVRRLTNDGISTYPSFSPSGLQIAFSKVDHSDPCSGSVWIMGGDGRDPHRLVNGTCARHYLRPVWIDTHTLIAWAWGPHGAIGLVRIAVPSGTVTRLIDAKIVDFSVSRAMGKVAMRMGNGQVLIWDADTASLTTLAGTTAGARVFLSGALELAY